jgi:hypothetical protein
MNPVGTHPTKKERDMKRTLILLAACFAILSLSACTLRAPAPVSVPIPQASPTALAAPATAAPTASLAPVQPEAAPTETLPTATHNPAADTAIPGGVVSTAIPGSQPGLPSGPYGVIQVAAGDVLNVHSAAGTGSSIIGTFAPTTNNVMRTGPNMYIKDALWVQVLGPGGGTGWVNSGYLTEYVPPAAFCADGRVNSLLGNLGNAVTASNGTLLYPLVSPLHGMAVRLWRNGNAVVFKQTDAKWIFSSTFTHNWGAAPGSGLDTVGAIHVSVIPKWLDVFNGSYTLSCDVPQTGGASYDTSWPASYANVNFYSLYKPGPAGNENSWRTLLIGVEYVQNQPYLFSVTQLQWEP